MFYLVGLGLKSEHLTLEALNALKKCAHVYVDAFTSVYADGSIKLLEGLLDTKVELLGRKKVEEQFSAPLERCKKEDIALCVFGAPLFATTHVQLLLDAREKGVEYRVLQGISVQSCLPELGLDAYKFGRVLTIVSPKSDYAPESFFDLLEANERVGLHSLCLLDLDLEQKQLMSVQEAVNVLEEIARKRGKLEWFKELNAVGVGGMGTKNQEAVFGRLFGLKKAKLKAFPQSLVVLGRLSEKECEALKAFGVEK